MFLVPTWQLTIVYNSSSREYNHPCQDSMGTAHTYYTYIHVAKTLRYIKFKLNENLKELKEMIEWFWKRI